MIDYREDNQWTVYVHIVPKELSGYKNDKYYVGITSVGMEVVIIKVKYFIMQ